jgi:hypothetical protein
MAQTYSIEFKEEAHVNVFCREYLQHRSQGNWALM